jgi:hypothetical protein
VRGADWARQEQGPARQGPRPPAHQEAQGHHPQDAQRRGFQDLGHVRDEDPQALDCEFVFVLQQWFVCEKEGLGANEGFSVQDLNAPTEVVKQIIINIEAGVEVEVTIAA